MSHDKIRLRRLLLLETVLAVGGILVASICYFISLERQQNIAEQLFYHPFAVSNASIEFRGDVLELRRVMLEMALARRPAGDDRNQRIAALEATIERNFATIQNEFLGERSHLDIMVRELALWGELRARIGTQLRHGDNAEAARLASEDGATHVDNLLRETDYVLSFARSRAQSFIDEGQRQMRFSHAIALILTVLVLTGFTWVTFRLRKAIYDIYGRVEHDATFDFLSGVYNRASLVRLGDMEVSRAQRHAFALSVVLIDLDHFKAVNDTHGHAAGDQVLRQFAGICTAHLREGDTLGRIGGEEFVIVLPHSDCDGAAEAAERLRLDVAQTPLAVGKGVILDITASFGVACLADGVNEFGELLRRADEALYQSKAAGRNRVTVAQ